MLEEALQKLRSTDEQKCKEAARMLGQMGDPQAVESLIAALNDSSSKVRQAVAEALGQIGDARAVDSLAAMLNDGVSIVRQTAVWALGQIGGAGAVKPLIAALKDENNIVRKVAPEALRKIGDKQAKIGDKQTAEALAPYNNLIRFRQSGQPKLWVETRNGSWNREDRLSLLDALKSSEFWPMEPELLEMVLAEELVTYNKLTDNNLTRWLESRQPWSWVKAHKGQWNQEDWLSLLGALKRSEYWPMKPDAVGKTLEDSKRSWREHEPDDNLIRWRESGQPWSWIEMHKGQWNHEDWLSLLETLKRSEYWPMKPDAVGKTLEELKRSWYEREGVRQYERNQDQEGIMLLRLILGRKVWVDRRRTQEAANQLKNGKAAGSRALAELVSELLACRSLEICVALEIAKELDPTSELISAIKAILSAPQIVQGMPGTFSPEIFGKNQIGWTDGGHERVTRTAREALKMFSANA